ncbi:MAG: hypothetical protein V1780_03600 [Chloroflexota bacterium]
MFVIKGMLKQGWYPVLITALALAGYFYQWPIFVLAPALITVMLTGLVVAAVNAREKELEMASLKLRQLAGYFNRRFAGNSSLSIFSVIDGLFAVDNPRLWDWARACDMSQRVFNTWCSGFIVRLESDIRTRRFDIYLHTYLNEMWLVNSHYYEFIEQFYEIADKYDLPRESLDLYNRFATEYNTFVQDLRDNISELKKMAKTEIEPPSVKFARELPLVK